MQNALAERVAPAARPAPANSLAGLYFDPRYDAVASNPTPQFDTTITGARDYAMDPRSVGNQIVMNMATSAAPVDVRGGAAAVQALRMQRAAEQGYDIRAYKAMYPETGQMLVRENGQWVERGQRRPITEFNNPDQPYAGFFSDSPAVANNFAHAFGRPAAVYPVRLRFSNPLEIDARNLPAGAFQFDALARQHGTLDDLARYRSAWSPNSAYDGVILRNTADEGTVYIPRTPQQARSEFANFAPDQRENPDMLASFLLPLFVGSAAASAGGGSD